MTTTPAPTGLDFDPACSCRRCGKCDRALGELAKTRAELKPSTAGPTLTCGTCYGSGETEGRDCNSCSIRAKRCASCDHLASFHQPEGCWYSVTVGTLDQNLVCPCAANPATTAEPAAAPFDCAPECRCQTTKAAPAVG